MSVSVKNPARRDNTGLDVVECTENSNTCVVYWVNLYLSLCPLYCYKSHARSLKVSLYCMIYDCSYFIEYFEEILQEYKYKNLIFKSNPDWKIGHNCLSLMTSIFSERCGFENPTLHKVCCKRAPRITMPANFSVL